MQAAPRSAVRLRERVANPTRLHWPAVAVIALVTAGGGLDIRRRDVTAALDSSVDMVIVAELAMFAAVALYLFLTVALPPRRRRLPMLLVAAWTLATILAVSASWAPSPTLALVRGGQLLITLSLATAIARRADQRDLALIAHAYVLVVTCWIVLGLFVRRPPPLTAGRFGWLYTHPVVAGSLLVMSTIILASWSTRRGGPRFLSTPTIRVLLVIHAGALLATQTRGAVIAVVAGLATLVWLRLGSRRRIDMVILAAVSSPLVIALAASIVRGFLLRGGSYEELRSLNSRTNLWSDAVTEVGKNPIFGRGYFSAREIFLDSIGLGGSHNAYIEIAVSAGLLGVAAFVWVIGSATVALWRLRHHQQQPLLAALLVAALVNAISTEYLAGAGTGANVLFLVLLGWIAALPRPAPDVATPPSDLASRPS